MAYFYLSDKNVEPPICLYSDSFKSRVDSDIGAMSSSVGRFANRAMSELEVEHIVRETNKTYRFAPQKTGHTSTPHRKSCRLPVSAVFRECNDEQDNA